jgi:hypothetical protein
MRDQLSLGSKDQHEDYIKCTSSLLLHVSCDICEKQSVCVCCAALVTLSTCQPETRLGAMYKVCCSRRGGGGFVFAIIATIGGGGFQG